MNKDKLLFVIRYLFNKFLPQAANKYNKNFISKFGKEISFYTGENHFTYKLGYSKKLKTKPKIKGLYFLVLCSLYDKDNIKF